jgi:hypothetical protein
VLHPGTSDAPNKIHASRSAIPTAPLPSGIAIFAQLTSLRCGAHELLFFRHDHPPLSDAKHGDAIGHVPLAGTCDERLARLARRVGSRDERASPYASSGLGTNCASSQSGVRRIDGSADASSWPTAAEACATLDS